MDVRPEEDYQEVPAGSELKFERCYNAHYKWHDDFAAVRRCPGCNRPVCRNCYLLYYGCCELCVP